MGDIVGTYSFTSTRLPGRTYFRTRLANRLPKAEPEEQGRTYNCNEFVEHLCDDIYGENWDTSRRQAAVSRELW